MKSLIAALLALCVVPLAGCDSQAEPNTSLMITYQVDPAVDRSWWLTKDGVVLHSAAAPKKVVTLPGWQWASAPFCPPHMALGPSGEAVVTTNVTNMLWRVDPQTLEVTVHTLELGAERDRDLGFIALVYSPEQVAYFGYSEGPPSVWKIDRQLTRATKVADVDLSRVRSARTANLRGPCAELAQRLVQFTRIGG